MFYTKAMYISVIILAKRNRRLQNSAAVLKYKEKIMQWKQRLFTEKRSEEKMILQKKRSERKDYVQ